jgi:hypothetical protein
MAAADPEHWVTIDAVGAIETVGALIHRALVDRGLL